MSRAGVEPATFGFGVRRGTEYQKNRRGCIDTICPAVTVHPSRGASSDSEKNELD